MLLRAAPEAALTFHPLARDGKGASTFEQR